MKTYTEYRQTEEPSIPRIPTHWTLIQLKNVAQTGIGLTYSPEDIVDKGQGIAVLRSGNIQGASIDYSDLITVNRRVSEKLMLSPGDIVMCARNGSASLVGKSAIFRGVSFPVTYGAFMTVIRSRASEFLFWVFNSELFRSHLGLFQTSTINQLTDSTLRNMRFAWPTLEEQRAIADFLDRETAEIDAFIADQERLIELLTERRTATITHAVTKGLDPSVPMRDSGVPWLGEIPAHWTAQPLKSVAQVRGRIGFRGYTVADIVDEGEGAVALSPSNIRDGAVQLGEKLTWISWEKYYQSPEIMVAPKDTLLVKTGSSFGKSAMYSGDSQPMTLNPQLVLVRAAHGVRPEYLAYQVGSKRVYSEFRSSSTGGTTPTMTESLVRNIALALPNNAEQDQIVAYLECEIDAIDSVIEDAKRAIELSKERRAALISAAVTGQIDVRTHA